MADTAKALADELAELSRRLDGVERTDRIAHSTIDVAGEPVPVPSAISQGVEAAEAIPGIQAEIDAAQAELQTALAEAQVALDEAALARAEAAQAVADAQAAVTASAGAVADALAAASAATAAQTTADGKNRVVRASTDAASPEEYQAGDQWWKYSGSEIVGLWIHSGSAWIQQTLTDAVITNLNAGTITAGTLSADRIGAGSIVAGKLAAQAVTAEKVAANAITAGNIAAGAIVTDALSAGSVTSEKVATGAVTADKISALSVTSEKLAAGAVTADKLSANSVTASTIAAGAINGMTVSAPQIYGGYIEAPTIASSANLGTGANVLNDPEFQSTVNTSWVASGHLGDASTTQTDTISWSASYPVSKAYPDTGTYTRQHVGSLVATIAFSPPTRTTGSLLFANYSWKPSNRTISNPHTFPTTTQNAFSYPAGGRSDPSFAAVSAPANNTGTARTTYLTNTAVFSVTSGDLWNVRATFKKLTSSHTPYVTVTVEVIDSSTSAVLWSRPVTAEELQAGLVSDTWTASVTASAKLRFKAVYTAAGGGATRKVNPGGYARVNHDGSLVTEWVAASDAFYSYGGGSLGGYVGGSIDTPASVTVEATSAIMAKIQPEQGWRLSEANGLELYNDIGTRTALLNGSSNYISGTLATAQTGQRWEVTGDRIDLYSSDNALLGSIRRDGSGIKISGEVTINGGDPSPIGTVVMFAGDTIPQGWLLCDGSAVWRSTYLTLFLTIGTAYGAGDGSITFNLPNLKGRVPVGMDAAQTEFDALGETGGAKTHTLTVAQTPAISGTVGIHGSENGSNLWNPAGVFANSPRNNTLYKPPGGSQSGAHSITTLRFDSGGSGQAHNNLQPYITMNYIIRAL